MAHNAETNAMGDSQFQEERKSSEGTATVFDAPEDKVVNMNGHHNGNHGLGGDEGVSNNSSTSATSFEGTSSFAGTKLDMSRNSDYTVPTSNMAGARAGSPPMQIFDMSSPGNESMPRHILPHPTAPILMNQHGGDDRLDPDEEAQFLLQDSSLYTKNHQQSSAGGPSLTSGEMTPPRRNIFGAIVEEKYQTNLDFSHCHPSEENLTQTLLNSQHQKAVVEALTNGGTASREHTPEKASSVNGETGVATTAHPDPSGLTTEVGEVENGMLVIEAPAVRPGLTRNSEYCVSELTLPGVDSWQSGRNVKQIFHNKHTSNGDAFIPTSRSKNHSNTSRKSSGSNGDHHHHHHKKSKKSLPHETIHAQSLLLGLAFCAVWSPSNLMAPNLTEMSEFFGFDEYQRDLFLGSYCALATGVFSFPIGAGIGILADMVNRKYLFCLTLVGGAISAWATGHVTNFPQLLFARLLNGGFMAGSVPVAFSLLGDLFAVEERNAASSGLTAMMGLGIILGQVYAGVQGPVMGWQHAFFVSSGATLVLAGFCLLLVQEPIRGGKEPALQDMIKSGTRYERKLSWEGFCHACLQNASNSILLWQGFFSSLPWGIIFVFLNDYLSQERGFSVPAATYLVFLFGMGGAVGGVLGGYWGQVVQRWNRRYLPLFMALTTELGILPFLGMLNVRIPRAHGTLGILFAFGSGLIASLPSVNVRPCLLNVNPPETRGATLTAANMLINLGRGIGPSCVTLLGMYVSRQEALNLTLTVFWTISSLQLVMLSRTLPKDQDAMEAELAKYAASAIKKVENNDDENPRMPSEDFSEPLSAKAASTTTVVVLDEPSERRPFAPILLNEQAAVSSSDYHISSNASIQDHESVELSIEDRMTYFDGVAVNETLVYVRQGFKEFKHELIGAMPHCGCGADVLAESSSEDNDSIVDDEDEKDATEDADQLQTAWLRQEERSKNQPTSLLYSGIPPAIQSFTSTSSDGPPSEKTPLIV